MTLRLALLVAGLAIIPVACADKPEYSRYAWDETERLIAVGDIHGVTTKLEDVLLELGLVDKSLKWTGGTTHLLFCGDLLDRGPREQDLLELVMRLETEAFEAGGAVHLLLGNHEVMNLVFDWRYVPKEGFASFADYESSEEREEGWEAYLARQGGKAGSAARKAFDDKYPPGYFARRRMFGPDGRYGSWLLTKPFVIRIGGNVFVHGGLT